MNAPLLPVEPTSFEQYREACFDEMGALMWAMRVHAEVGERYAALRSRAQLDMVRHDMRACFLRLDLLLKEAAFAERGQI